MLREGRANEALAVLEATLARFPHFPPLYANAALAARRLGDESRAEALAEKGRGTDPFLPFVRGTFLLEEGKYAAAEAQMQRARKLRPESVTFAAWLAQAQWLGGRPGEARATFEEARRLGPNNPLVTELARSHPGLAHSKAISR